MVQSTTYFFLVPLILGLLFPFTFVVTYVTAVYNGHITIGFTFISDAGSLPPESCIFAQLLNLAASLMVMSVYVRYRQLATQTAPYRPSLPLLRAGLWTGWISAFGISMVGNFQFSNMPVLHGLGALLCFGVGIASLWIQVASTKLDPPERYSGLLVRLRWTLAMMATCSFILTISGAAIAWIKRGGKRNIHNYHLGYEWFLLSCVNEWIMAISMSVFIATFVKESRGMTITPPQIKLRELNEAQVNNTISEEISRYSHKLKPCNIL